MATTATTSSSSTACCRTRMEKPVMDKNHNLHDDDDSLSFGSSDSSSTRLRSQESLFQESRSNTKSSGTVTSSNNNDNGIPLGPPPSDNDCHSTITTTVASQPSLSLSSSQENSVGTISTTNSRISQRSQTFRRTGELRTKNQRLRALGAPTATSTTDETRQSSSLSVASVSSINISKRTNTTTQPNRQFRFCRPPKQRSKKDSPIRIPGPSPESNGAHGKRTLPQSQPSHGHPSETLGASAHRKNSHSMERSRNKTDVFAIQDYGNQQILHDECMFLCSNIMTANATTSLSARLIAASDLLRLLSSSSNRRTLFVPNTVPKESSVLSAILSVWIWMCRYPKDKYVEELCNDPIGSQHDDGVPRNKRARHGESTLSPSSHDDKTWFLLQNILLCCWHFLSTDCTLDCAALSHKSRYACQMRTAILQYPDCIASLFQWIQNNDPMIPSLHNQMNHFIGIAYGMPKTRDRLGLEPNSPESLVSSTSTSMTNSSISSQRQLTDPTVAGRRRQKKGCRQGLLHSIPEHGTENGAKDNLFALSSSPTRPSPSSTPSRNCSVDAIDSSDSSHSQLSFSASCSQSMTMELEDGPIRKARDIYDSIALKIAATATSTKPHLHHICCNAEDDTVTTHWVRSVLPVLAIQRIVNGKMENSDVSCMDEQLEKSDEEKNPSFSQGSDYKDKMGYNDDDANDDNPLLLTNKLMAENECLPSLSQALANTLALAVRRLQARTNQKECPACLEVLQDRVCRLGALVDGASLWSASNRRSLSEEGFHCQPGGYLIIGLVTVLSCFLNVDKIIKQLLFHGGWGDIALSTLRTLTSLTHENEIAAKELEAPIPNFCVERDNSTCGLDIVPHILYAAATTSQNDDGTDSKLRYDSIIFCLNTLTNAIESGASRRILEKITIKVREKDNKNFLSWLTRWLVNETHTFQDAVVESTFGSEPSKHEHRRLASHEAEKLVTAGNGFVLLSCLMLDDDANERVPTSREIIMRELPGETQGTKILYVRNTLKAFCNFYHFSVGDLSVAVVAPVKTLIMRLEELQKLLQTDISTEHG